VFLLVWHTAVTLAYVALIGLAVWGIATLVRSGTSFSPVLITGIYATFPALIARYMMRQVGSNFPGLFTLVILPVWGSALALTMMSKDPQPMEGKFVSFLRADRPLRGWRALIAVPFLLDVALDIVFGWKAWFVTWPLGLLTMAALIGVSLLPLVNQEATPPPGV
jgi:hypothetical protein